MCCFGQLQQRTPVGCVVDVVRVRILGIDLEPANLVEADRRPVDRFTSQRPHQTFASCQHRFSSKALLHFPCNSQTGGQHEPTLIVKVVCLRAAVGLVDHQAFAVDAPGETLPDIGTLAIDIEMRLTVGQEVSLVGVLLIGILPDAAAARTPLLTACASGFSCRTLPPVRTWHRAAQRRAPPSLRKPTPQRVAAQCAAARPTQP